MNSASYNNIDSDLTASRIGPNRELIHTYIISKHYQ